MKIIDDLKELLNSYNCVNLNYIEACGYECNITKERYFFKDKLFFDGKWNYCETFKLIFDDNDELISIENI